MNTNEQGDLSFDHPPSVAELVNSYERGLEKDPASIHYKRINIRPSVNIVRAVVYCAFVLILSSAISIALAIAWGNILGAVLIGVGVALLTFIIFIKKIAIWFVKVYQHYAPDRVRDKCRFEPSCSQYMIISIEKYGFIRGFIRGIRRLRRCQPPNGGFDEP